LIWIKAATGISSIVLPGNSRSSPMSTNFIVLATIVAAFGVFAATLFWADVQTRRVNR
jgi:hypothetical protein